jgi:hypothetical protein
VSELNESIDVDIIKFIKHVSYYCFITPQRMNLTREDTIFNSTSNDLKEIAFDFPRIPTNLHFYDPDGTCLEFYVKETTEVDEYPYVAYVIFPQEKPVRVGEYRTIISKSLAAYDISTLVGFRLQVPFPKGEEVYVYIESCKDYELNIKYYFCNELGVEITKFNSKIENNKNFFEIYSKAIDNNYEVINIEVRNNIPLSTLTWYLLGLVSGGVLSLLVPVLYFFDPDGITNYITFASILLSILIIVKGWMTQFEIGRQLLIYDIFYLFIIISILLEIIGMTVHYYFFL